MRERLRDLLALLVLGALVLVCFARLCAAPGALVVDPDRPSIDLGPRSEARPIGNDLTQFFLPHHLRIAQELRQWGRFACWDAFGFGGRPRVGNPQAGLWYPPVWLAWWSGSPAALGWLTVAHLIFGGIGTYLLARGIGASRPSALVAGGVFEAAPYLLAQAWEGHLPHVWAACWYPWAFGAAWLLRRGDARGAPALALVLALTLLAGHPQEWYYLVVALAGWALADVLGRIRRDRAQLLPGMKNLACWCGVGVLALGLAAVELVPDFLASAWTLRSGRLSLQQAGQYHVTLLNLLQLLDPLALGGPADYVGHENYWETVLSIGWIPLVLSVIAWVASPRRPAVRAWALLTGLSLVFAAGWRLGFFALCYELVPGMNRFRVPARALFLASLGGAMLAGLGVEAVSRLGSSLEQGNASWRRAFRAILLALAGLVALGQAAGLVRDSGREPSFLDDGTRWLLAAGRLGQSPVFAVAVVGSTLALAWLKRKPGQGGRIALLLGALAFVELAAHGYAVVRVASAERFLGLDPMSAILIRERTALGPYRIRAHDAFYGDLRAARHGIEKTNINDLFQIQNAAEVYQALYPLLGPPGLRTLGLLSPEPARRAQIQGVLDQMNVALLVTDRPEPGAPWPVLARGTWRTSEFLIYRNPAALPRAYVVPRALVASERADPVALFGQVNPRACVIMSSDPLSGAGSRQEWIPAAYDASEPDRVVVEATTKAPGLLVVADTWMPGWTATVDGCRVPILRGNHAQRVVALPRPGPHRIVMAYRPPGLQAGLLLTGLSGVLWAGMLLLAWRQVFSSLGPRRQDPMMVHLQIADDARGASNPLARL